MNLLLENTIAVPVRVTRNLRAFRRWTKSEAYPERGDYFYLGGDLWVDLSMETLLHNQLKSLFNIILGGMLLQQRLGLYFADRMRFVSVDANVSCEPDGMYVSHESHNAGRVTWRRGPQSLEVIGTPDMVLEVVSSYSVHKDTVILRELYAAAGIPEYWLVNPLGGQLNFDILRLTGEQYTPTRKVAGYAKSSVFGKSFRLVQENAGAELPEIRLLVR
jgi:Uma2 family endonuclease